MCSAQISCAQVYVMILCVLVSDLKSNLSVVFNKKQEVQLCVIRSSACFPIISGHLLTINIHPPPRAPTPSDRGHLFPLVKCSMKGRRLSLKFIHLLWAGSCVVPPIPALSELLVE